MPIFRILYTNDRTGHAITETIEWVTDGSWDQDRTRQEFQQRHPGTAIVQLREIECC